MKKVKIVGIWETFLGAEILETVQVARIWETAQGARILETVQVAGIWETASLRGYGNSSESVI